ncbi:MAG TPA: FliH/SctL family protein [Terracidiphilus sp.]|jgi:flagellar assembly protein FliH|nr:FliH/SctL family protein [Terracidiphilus sp.]
MSSSPEFASAFPVPIATLQYRDMSSRKGREGGVPLESLPVVDDGAHKNHGQTAHSEAELAVRIARERAEAANEVELRMRKEYEQKLSAAREPIAAMLAGFEEERSHYYAQVEMEIVQLALSIAAKILHREAQVDPMLLAALVRLAVERMADGSSVTVRVSPGRGASWNQYFAGIPSLTRVKVEEDPQLSNQDCILETELGSANFGLDSQLKEVEQGFFDLLALRPGTK